MATQAQVPHRTLAMALVARLRRPTLGMVVTNIVLLALVVVMVIPYLYMALSSFKVNSEIFSYPLTLWPHEWTWDNLSALVRQFPYGRWYVNTIVVAAIGTTLSVSLSSLAGFAFAKYDFRFKNVLFTIMLATLMIPFQVLLVPQFQIIKTFNWFNSYQALFVPSAAGAAGPRRAGDPLIPELLERLLLAAHRHHPAVDVRDQRGARLADRPLRLPVRHPAGWRAAGLPAGDHRLPDLPAAVRGRPHARRVQGSMRYACSGAVQR